MTFDEAETLFVNLSVACHDGITSFGDVQHLEILIAIKDNDDVFPCIATGMVLETERHHTVMRGQELQMSAHQVSITQSEGRMVGTQRDEVTIVFEHLRIAR